MLHWEEPILFSYVTGYKHSYNRYVISPRLQIYPVTRGTATQTSLNVTNWERIINLDLRPNTPVAFKVVANAIADLDEDLTFLLHRKFEGRFEEYCGKVRHDEEVNRQHLQ